MTDHQGYINAVIICATCGNTMNLSVKNNPIYSPGEPISWVVVCENQICPHLGVPYRVKPQVELIRV
jgi:hypothetical protein